jgi:hypothetical protein
MTWNSGSMSDDFTGPTAKEAEEAEAREEILEADSVTDLDDVYRQRNRMVAFAAAEYPSTFIVGADDKWPDFAVVYVDLPTGQTSWHIGPRDFDLFDFMPKSVPGSASWDGHTDDEKHDRIQKYTRMVYTARMATEMVGSLQSSQPPYGEPFIELDEDFYVHDKTIMCRLTHEGEGAIVGRWTLDMTEEQISALLQEHDRVHHDGPGDNGEE